jgi:hypothetical protein
VGSRGQRKKERKEERKKGRKKEEEAKLCCLVQENNKNLSILQLAFPRYSKDPKARTTQTVSDANNNAVRKYLMFIFTLSTIIICQHTMHACN